MQLPEYWRWIKLLWRNPCDGDLRMIFADWLDEHSMPAAARRQRQWAGWIKNAREMVYIPSVEQVYFRTKKDKTGYFRIKKDGTVHPMRANMEHWNFGREKHTLKGG